MSSARPASTPTTSCEQPGRGIDGPPARRARRRRWRRDRLEVTFVGLHDHRAPGGQRRGGVAAHDAEREREVARREHADRAERDAHAAQVGRGAPCPSPGRRGRWRPEVAAGQRRRRRRTAAGTSYGAARRAAVDGQVGLAPRERDQLLGGRVEGDGDRAQPASSQVVALRPRAAGVASGSYDPGHVGRVGRPRTHGPGGRGGRGRQRMLLRRPRATCSPWRAPSRCQPARRRPRPWAGPGEAACTRRPCDPRRPSRA